ncbi:hypothetical protein M9Y10_023331 [Tritrichomonas musculus]|uniref:Uncharacterized protein n=1 Tax=Tritrichomonas musculus TaxID=1915356 RepID=A0ABR2KY01_9EUKA
MEESEDHPLSGSFQIFEQALKSGDDSLVTFILRKFSDTLISDLIHAMQPSLINDFLRTFTDYIQRNPESLAQALPWIEECIDYWESAITASSICQRRIAELQYVFRQRTQQIGIFIEVDSLSSLVHQEKEGVGIGLPIDDHDAQILSDK